MPDNALKEPTLLTGATFTPPLSLLENYKFCGRAHARGRNYCFHFSFIDVQNEKEAALSN